MKAISRSPLSFTPSAAGEDRTSLNDVVPVKRAEQALAFLAVPALKPYCDYDQRRIDLARALLYNLLLQSVDGDE
jgi:hypothetical protein